MTCEKDCQTILITAHLFEFCKRSLMDFSSFFDNENKLPLGLP